MGHVEFDPWREINRITRQDSGDGFRYLLVRQRMIGRDEDVQ